MVSQQLIKDLQIVIKEEYKKDLSIAEVSRIANDIVGFYDLLAKVSHRNTSKSNK